MLPHPSCTRYPPLSRTGNHCSAFSHQRLVAVPELYVIELYNPYFFVSGFFCSALCLQNSYMLCVGVVLFFFIAVEYSLCDYITIAFLTLTFQFSKCLLEKYRQSSPRDLMVAVEYDYLCSSYRIAAIFFLKNLG